MQPIQSPPRPPTTLQELIRRYRNEAGTNDEIHDSLTKLTAETPLLRDHRAYVEQHHLGFGDPAFHAMWWLILRDLADRVARPRLLEVGVYKGQVISLWAVLAAQNRTPIELTAVSPLEGQPLPESVWVRRWRWLTSRAFRDACRAGNFYAREDYESLVRELFQRFGVSFDAVELFRGYSTDSAIRTAVGDRRFDLIYIDGDHTYEGAASDVRWLAPRVEPGGFLVLDDAAFFLPGTKFWKGYESVSKAAELVPEFGFMNVLNVGHNRVFQKIG